MNEICSSSLATTLDRLSAIFFHDGIVPGEDAFEVALWIAERQGAFGSYAGMPAPSKLDYDEGIRLFTGERIRTRAGIGHVLGQEACRALRILNAKHPLVRSALENAEAMADRLDVNDGTYCCATCTCSLWRHMAVGGYVDLDHDRFLSNGLSKLKTERDGNGRWGRFPFYYTLLSLTELEHSDAVEELRYAAPACQRLVGRQADGVIRERRHLLVKRVLNMVD